ncbi:AbgT family transporter [Inediibacterium massiliense]|uniref:AbgT family transporter n=1 Tax=Inediibacterium massiliense TaxID=1658111 RepID=UPI0006B46D0D|nr:AbgT family transporter [Inediibacterium massiliense]
MVENCVKKKGAFRKFLDWVERVGNKLPHPFTLFVILAVTIMIVSAIVAGVGVKVIHPGTQEEVAVKSLLSKDGILWIIGSFLDNFIGFKPLGLVLVMTFGIGLAEEVGFVFTSLRKLILGVPKSLVTATVIFAGIIGNLASDAAFVVIPPLAALIFLAVKRHPLAGIAAGFAGVGAGFTANLLVAGTDALLAGITNEAAKSVVSGAVVSPVSNWYFLIASTFVLTFVGSWITDKIVEPRLGEYKGGVEKELEELTPIENKGLRNAGIAAIIYIGILLIGIVPQSGMLRNPETHTIIPSPFLSGIIPILMMFFIVIGLSYGITVGSIKNEKDIPKMLGKVIKGMSGYIVLVFAASQFIAFFNWSNMGTVIAVKGAAFLEKVGFTGIPLIVGFIIVTTIVNLFIGSGSAKWALLAPIFVPMLSLVGFSPAFIQLAYRIGDSATNPMSPLFPYFPVVLAFVQEYDEKAGVGTLLSLMIPYSFAFIGIWVVQMIIWMSFNLPLGPDALVYLMK